jgi:hypothetical protein
MFFFTPCRFSLVLLSACFFVIVCNISLSPWFVMSFFLFMHIYIRLFSSIWFFFTGCYNSHRTLRKRQPEKGQEQSQHSGGESVTSDIGAGERWF